MPHADAAERRTLPIAVLLALATLLAYWPVVHCGYLNLDDDLYVTANPAVWGGLTLAGARWAFTTMHAGFWHPLTWLSHMLDVELWGSGPAGPHATNLLLHVALVLLLLDHWPIRRGTSLRLVVEKIPLLGLAASAAVAHMVTAQRAGAIGHLARFPLEARLANALVSYARYVGKTVWPSGLAVFYPYPKWPAWQVAGAAVLLMGVTTLALVQMRRRPYLLVG